MSENLRTYTTEHVDDESQTESESEEEELRCPECDGQLATDTEHGETVCVDCGLVVEEDEIDRGPEWRAFDSKEKDEKSRVGAPTTNMMHDKGLSTNIGWQDKDAYGKSLSSRQREKMQRLRTWNERFRTRDSKERNLKQALAIRSISPSACFRLRSLEFRVRNRSFQVRNRCIRWRWFDESALP